MYVIQGCRDVMLTDRGHHFHEIAAMAELPIERKESRNWLPLILAALAVLLVLGYCAMRNRDTTAAVAGADTTNTMTPSTATPAVAGAANSPGALIDQFVQFTQQRDTTNETEGQHQYTAEGTRRLAAALEAIAGAGAAAGTGAAAGIGAGASQSIAVYADSMRRSIDRLQQSSATDVHSDDAKAAFSAAVSAMEQIDRARGTTRDVAPMRAIYNELSSNNPLLPQLPVVDRFFKAAADALQSMRG